MSASTAKKKKTTTEKGGDVSKNRLPENSEEQ